MKKLLLITLAATSISYAKAQMVLISHKNITIQYDTLHKRSNNVRYILKADSLQKLSTHRSQFHLDPKLDKKYQWDTKSYENSIYDRGHLAPDRDFIYSKVAEYEVMSMTNIVPQNKNFNRGLWKSIETYVRDLSYRFDSLEVVTGVIYKTNEKINGIPVPSHFYKIVNTYKYKLIFFCKNEPCKNCDIDDFLITEKEFYKLVN